MVPACDTVSSLQSLSIKRNHFGCNINVPSLAIKVPGFRSRYVESLEGYDPPTGGLK